MVGKNYVFSNLTPLGLCSEIFFTSKAKNLRAKAGLDFQLNKALIYLVASTLYFV